MAAWRQRSVCFLAGLCVLFAAGCVNPLDPFGKEDEFRRMQKRFTQYVRWGKVHEASSFVVDEQRAEFLALAPELSEIRFTDYEITQLEYDSDSAEVDVTLRGYRLSEAVEKIVQLNQSWAKDGMRGPWRVRLEMAELRSGLGAGR